MNGYSKTVINDSNPKLYTPNDTHIGIIKGKSRVTLNAHAIP